MVKTAKLRIGGMAMSKTKISIEGLLNRAEKRLLESDEAPDKDYIKRNFRDFPYGRNEYNR